MTTDTPRTDAAALEQPDGLLIVHADFARTLERDLSECRVEVKKQQVWAVELTGDVATLRAALAERQAALEQERTKFQLETLRSSRSAVLLRKFAEVYSIDHFAEPWSKACHRCDLLRETKELLDEPTNAVTFVNVKFGTGVPSNLTVEVAAHDR